LCRWGFSSVIKTLQSVSDKRLRAYIVWLPIFGGDFRGQARKLSDSFPDKRVSYFLDPESFSGTLWEEVLKTEREIAWDVYLLYGAGAVWDKVPPPQPAFWMHQLNGVTKAPRLNQTEFAAKLKQMLIEVDSTARSGTASGFHAHPPKRRGGSLNPQTEKVGVIF
jgi:hypothetical protein